MSESQWVCSSVHVLNCHLYILFIDVSLQIFFPLFSYCWVLTVPHLLWIQAFCCLANCKYILPSWDFSPQTLNSIIHRKKTRLGGGMEAAWWWQCGVFLPRASFSNPGQRFCRFLLKVLQFHILDFHLRFLFSEF